VIDGKVFGINRARAEAQHAQQTSGLAQEIAALRAENVALRAENASLREQLTRANKKTRRRS
jgi:regulator of replication initiation timing